jgi:hypothetical protein
METTRMDEGTKRHLLAWWDETQADYEPEEELDRFIEWLETDLDYWMEHGWPSAWSAFRVTA